MVKEVEPYCMLGIANHYPSLTLPEAFLYHSSEFYTENTSSVALKLFSKAGLKKYIL